jgi:hypothetical protein
MIGGLTLFGGVLLRRFAPAAATAAVRVEAGPALPR